MYPSAQEDLNETREKLYLKVLQTVCGSLNSSDAEYELQEKAVHTIANEYIKNRKAGDILLEELRGYDEQMEALETALIEESQLVERLEKARESDRGIHDNMIAEMRDLEQMCEKYRSEIEALENDLLQSDGIINKKS